MSITNYSLSGPNESSFKVSKFVDDFKVFDSGILHCGSNGKIRLRIDDFEVNFIFATDNTISTSKIDLELDSNPGLSVRLILKNFDNPLGSGLLEPAYLVNRIENARQLAYTFLTK